MYAASIFDEREGFIMRKNIKRQLLEIIQTIYEAIEVCKKHHDINLLVDCQNAAVFIGEKIEETEGVGTAAVMQLEQFVDFLYNAGLVIDNATELRKTLNKSRDKLKQAEHEIKVKLPITYEILFLPYKASMWDSLDSIYREVAKQADCHAVVMPIPYFNINPQREIIGMEYEGKLFPTDLEITDYNNYSISEIQPDVIFIHNPYDDCNFVTQVPPQYFSSELAKYTDKLVYIPYFVNDGATIREHYCQLPAVQNSWRTFVHSEKVRDVYCKFNPSEKIVALGSPKFDTVVRYDNEKPEIPKEWAKVFEGKKVFLYNTHLRNIIGHAEKMIDKLEYVFSEFEKCDDAALLWRPHPLSIQTAKSMNPYILDKYMKLIERFKKMSNGVYDDTADIHRAIAISDAYIGDWSSVVSMYGVTGKPMFIINEPEIYKDNPFDYVLSYAGVSTGEGIYIFSSEYNALMCVRDNVANYVTEFEKEHVCKRDMFIDIIKYNNELILIPNLSDYIVWYNMQNNTSNSYKLNIDSEKGKCVSPILYKNSIYMPMCSDDCIIRFDLKTHDVKYFFDLFGKENNKSKVAFHYATQIENYMFIACLEMPKLLMWDMDSDKGTIINIPDINEGCVDVAINENDIYLLSYPSKDIWKWSRKSNTIKCIAKNCGIQKIHLYNDKLFMIPSNKEKISVMDTKTNTITELTYPSGFKFLDTYKKNWTKYVNYKISDNKMMLFPRNANMYIELDMDNYTMVGKKWTLCDDMKQSEFKDKRLLDYNYLYIDGRCDIKNFISAVNADTDIDKKNAKKYLCRYILNCDGSSGKNIWKYVYKYL